MIKVGVNGFGRIGALFVRAYLENNEWRRKFKIVAINASGVSGNIPPEDVARRLMHDSNYGNLNKLIVAFPDLIVYFGDSNEEKSYEDGGRIWILGEPKARKLPWGKLGVDVVIDCTGEHLTRKTAGKHLQAGAKMVVLSAPPKDDKIPMFVYGVNHSDYKPEMKIISNASCTTNALAPIIKTFSDKMAEPWEITGILFTTVHAFTGDQRLTDGKHKDPRRARRSSGNIIPTETGAAKNITKIFPKLKGKIDGLAYRVDTPTVSILDIDFVCYFAGKQGEAEIINNFDVRESAKKITGKALFGGDLGEILGTSEEELVSSDFVKDERACVIDVPLIKTVNNGRNYIIKIPAWYDNEWGYVCQLGRLLNYVISKM